MPYTMYLSHFGLSEPPFGITPDTSFAFSGSAHQEALNTLLIAARSGEGFMKITGEVGTGKTLLCRRFLATLGEGFVTAYLPNPYLEPRTLLLALAEELGVAMDKDSDQYHLLKALNLGLLNIARQKKAVVLCLDEAQAMPMESLEMLRLLSNLETEKRKLLQLVLFGQPELDEKLANPSVRQLRQRIAFHYRLGGLKRGELDHYLGHRLRVAGHRGNRVFPPASVRLIHRASEGTPRLVNILAHKAMLSAYGEGRQEVLPRHVRAAARDTEGVRLRAWRIW
jgi:MSHA biogenesis protein MshM